MLDEAIVLLQSATEDGKNISVRFVVYMQSAYPFLFWFLFLYLVFYIVAVSL